MKKNDYLICYDISDMKRLRKIARFLEQRCIRIQFSIFFAQNFSKEDIYNIADNLIEMMDPKEDDIRIYKIKNYGISLGKAYDLSKIFLIH